MNNTRRVFVCLLGLVVILSILVFPVSAQGNDSGAVNNTENATVNYQKIPPSNTHIQTEFDILAESQRGFDSSLSILNTVATMMGVVVGLLTLVVVIVGGFGIFQIKSWHDLKKDVDEKVKIIENLKIKAEEDAEAIRNELRNIPQTVSTEKPSDEVLRKLADFSHNLETLELMGASLKSEDYINMGRNFYFKEEYGSALKAYEKAIELEPDDALMWTNKALCLIKMDRYNEAIEASDKAIDLRTDYAVAWFNRACAYSLMGNKEKALSDLEKAIELDKSYKEKAKKDEDFKNLWDDDKFKKLVE